MVKDKLKRLLQSKEREKKDEAMHIKDIERLVTEIEMLKVVLYLVVRRRRVSLLLYQVRG
jgi:hypothetical protein